MIKFGRNVILNDQIFFSSVHSYGIVNLKPLVQGHSLVISKTEVPLLEQLNKEEYNDLFHSVRVISSLLKFVYKTEALNVSVQDGLAAGQSVAHVHVHILPRRPGDFKRNDEVYESLDRLNVKSSIHKERKTQSVEEMAKEASFLRSVLVSPEFQPFLNRMK